MTKFDPKNIRKAFGSYMTGVTVVTAMTDEGTPVGFTANSFTSVSLEPPLLLVCPAKSLSSFAVFAACRHFAVNILREDQQDISNIFASAKGDRFTHIDWYADEHNNPIIKGALTHFSCKTERNLAAGDHHILMGEVLDFTTHEGNGLGYCAGGYFSLGLERQAAALSTQQKHVTVGVILEYNGQVLLSQKADKMYLPSIMTDDKSNAVSSIQQFLADKGIDAQLGTVFSIYEEAKNHANYIFYRATAKSSDTRGLGEYIAIDSIAEKTFVTSAMSTMMTRYVKESEQGNYGVYVGTDESGNIH